MKKIILNNIPYIVENNNYSTITFDLVYPYKYDKNHMFDNKLFKQIVMNSSFDYKTEREFKIEQAKKLIINFSCRISRYHNNLFIVFSLTVPDPKKVKIANFEEAFNFFFRTIYYPNIKDEAFDVEQFEREKKYIKFNIQNSIRKIYNYSYQRFIQFADDIGDLKNNRLNNIDLIEKSNPKDLYSYYKEVIIDNQPILLVYGDVDKEQIQKIYNEYFRKNENKIVINKDYDCYMKLSEDPNIIEESSDYNQSVLYMCYKVKDMSENDKMYLRAVCDILNNGSTNLVFKKLRTENNLIYSHKFARHIKNGMFYIEAYIEKNNKEKTINEIKNLMSEIKNEKLIEECIEKIVNGIQYRLIELEDSKYYKFDKYIDDLFGFNISVEQMLEFYQKIDIGELKKFMDRIKLDTIYFLRGEKNEG